jgi:hypothetical protein
MESANAVPGVSLKSIVKSMPGGSMAVILFVVFNEIDRDSNCVFSIVCGESKITPIQAIEIIIEEGEISPDFVFFEIRTKYGPWKITEDRKVVCRYDISYSEGSVSSFTKREMSSERLRSLCSLFKEQTVIAYDYIIVESSKINIAKTDLFQEVFRPEILSAYYLNPYFPNNKQELCEVIYVFLGRIIIFFDLNSGTEIDSNRLSRIIYAISRESKEQIARVRRDGNGWFKDIVFLQILRENRNQLISDKNINTFLIWSFFQPEEFCFEFRKLPVNRQVKKIFQDYFYRHVVEFSQQDS